MFIQLDYLLLMFTFFREQSGSELIDGVFAQFDDLRQRLAEGIEKNDEQIRDNDAEINRLALENDRLFDDIQKAEKLDERLAELTS